MAIQSKKVVVVGGSVSGLMAALTLTRAGCDVTVLERIEEKAFIDQGSGLGLRADVMAFLNTYISKNVSINVLEGSDTTILEQDSTPAGMAPWPKGMYTTNWTSLSKALRQSLKTGFTFGAKVTGIREVGQKLVVEYEHNGMSKSIQEVDLAIGADGANSTVRSLMGCSPPRNYVGYVLYRGVAPIKDLSPDVKDRFNKGGNYMVVHNHSNCLIYRTSADQVMWGLYRFRSVEQKEYEMTGLDGSQHRYSLPPGLMKQDVLADLKAHARASFCREVYEAVELADTAMIQVITECQSPQNNFMNGRVLLIGEASTLPRPHVAAGAGHSAYHAQRLRDLVEGKINVVEWSENTKAYSDVLRDFSREQGHIWMEMDGNAEVVLESRAAMGRMVQEQIKVAQSLKLVQQ